MRKSKILKNIVSGFGGQLIVIILGLIVPRIFIHQYGSDVNGVVVTVSQIFTYMALLEAGIGMATKNLLYKPFQEGDKEGVIEVASISKLYYRRFTLLYGIGVVILSALLPVGLKTEVDHVSVGLIVLLEGMSGVVSFYYIQTSSIIIDVDGKSYINNSIRLFNKIFAYAVKITMAAFGWSVVLLQLVYFIITVSKVIIYKLYFQKHYNWLVFKKVNKSSKLKDRNSYIIDEICWTIFSSTDTIVLSMFVSTQLSSVYGIYNMIFANITVLLNAVYSSVNYLLGQAYFDNKERYLMVHDSFNSIFMGLITTLMVVCLCLANPFVMLYTKGIQDVNYIYPSLPLLFCLVQMLSWSRFVSGNLIGVAGRIKKAVPINVAEAVINLVLSVVLVYRYEIMGVLIATVVALPLKLVYCNYIGDKVILKRSSWNTIRILGGNYALFAVAVLLQPYLSFSIEGYFQFFLYGFLISAVVFCVVALINIAINPAMIKMTRRFLK